MITVTYSYLILSLEYPSKFGSILYPNKLLTNNLSKLISEISAINASLFTNNLIIERYIRDLNYPDG